MVTFSKTYWDTLYRENKTGWDIGYPSPALIEYIDQLKDKSIRILIPGAGNAHEAMVLIEKGFSNTYILDFSDLPIQRFKEKYPQFPVQNILKENFFNHKATYDLILEQTFFSSLHPTQREQYVAKMYDLLSKKGKLAGLLFDRNFGLEIPPFGGSKTEYKQLFGGKFNIHTLETAYNSIKPRLNTELFFIFEKNNIMSQNIILNNEQINHKLRRIAYQIYENNAHEKELILAGITGNGYYLTQKLSKQLKKISDLDIQTCEVNINKKDVFQSVTTSLSEEKYKNKSLVLVDDVLHTGTTLMYAIKHFLNVPLKQFHTAVLIDRNHKKYPVKADFKGLSLSTSLKNHVEVVVEGKEVVAYLE